MDHPRSLYRLVEIGLILLVLAGVGTVKFSRLTAEEELVIELEASLEQLYALEIDHFRRHKRYFDPEAPEYRDYLVWLDEYECEVRAHAGGFTVIAKADLDGDGVVGVWQVDQSGPVPQVLVSD